MRLKNLSPLQVIPDRIEEPFIGIRERLNAQGFAAMDAPKTEVNPNDFLGYLSQIMDAMPEQTGDVIFRMSDEAYNRMRLTARYLIRRDRKKRMAGRRRQ